MSFSGLIEILQGISPSLGRKKFIFLFFYTKKTLKLSKNFASLGKIYAEFDFLCPFKLFSNF